MNRKGRQKIDATQILKVLVTSKDFIASIQKLKATQLCTLPDIENDNECKSWWKINVEQYKIRINIVTCHRHQIRINTVTHRRLSVQIVIKWIMSWCCTYQVLSENISCLIMLLFKYKILTSSNKILQYLFTDLRMVCP